MNILDLLHTDGHMMKKVATTHGGEYCGPCPFCGGTDRFRVWPESGRYWCRSCGKAGDEIQYLRDRRGLSYVDACRYLGNEPKRNGDKCGNVQHLQEAYRDKTDKLSDLQEAYRDQISLSENLQNLQITKIGNLQESKTPGEPWRRNASAFLDVVIKNLWAPSGAPVRQWLNAEKGLSDETIKKARLGYSRADLFEPRASWSLSANVIDGKERKLWIPGGLVIPFIHNGDVHRLRIRRDNPGDGSRYVVVSGSSPAPLMIGRDKAAAVIVESEIDAWLISQEAGDLIMTISMGNAQAKPDTATHTILKDTPIILNSLDTDDAGAKAAWKFWPETYGGKVRRWPAIHGKDASAARLNGLNIREWIIAGMFGDDEKTFERFCIQTIDGGLSDREAINLIGR
ncbi:MAG TPA: primase-helicase zinc-binding domain-containing protein [Smithella sp.]|nr:primase-helicase zinc-binding domain-containing protein [Smithella sp.]HQG65250.1 primase-helicase zinc-binding domain-containing protein [Smithella sp.]